MPRHFLLLLIAFGALANATPLPAADAGTGRSESTLRIGLLEESPFSMHRNGTWNGLSIDLWQAVAARGGFTVEWVPTTREAMTRQLRDGTIDVGPALTITTDRLRELEFSPPILASGIAIATIEERAWNWRATLRNLWDSGLFGVVAVILLANVVTGFLLWRIERTRNPANFGGPQGDGFASGVWCSISTMTTVGYGDRVPVTVAGRLLCFFIMLSGVIVISLFTATATSTLTVAHLRPRVHNAEDLKHAVSVAIDGSAGAQYLKSHQLPMVTAPDWAGALALLERGTVAAFVGDRVELRAGFKGHPGRVAILPLNLEEEFFAFPLGGEPGLRRRVGIALQQYIDSAGWDQLDAAYLGE